MNNMLFPSELYEVLNGLIHALFCCTTYLFNNAIISAHVFFSISIAFINILKMI
jgi:hypothetical protein